MKALAASLYIVGLKEEARRLMKSFQWGEEFFKINKDLLDGYAGKK